MRLLLYVLMLISTACVFVSADEAIPDGPQDEGPVNIFDAIMKENVRVEKQKKKSRILFEADSRGGKVIQGDISVFNEDPYLKTQHSPVQKPYAVLGWPRKLWRTRVVPYDIRHSGTSRLSSYQAKLKILDGLKEIEKVSCVRFRPKTSQDRNWLLYVKGSGGCYSGIGKRISQGSPTTVRLGDPCVNMGIIIHETLHALGFYHEQCRRDRNNYVNIYFKKVLSSMRDNFDMYEAQEASTFGLDYDYKSIMHYSKTTFTVDGSNTMEAKEDPNLVLGGAQLSPLDVKKINMAYHCHDKGKLWTEWSGWSPCVKNFRGDCKRSKHRICFAEDLRRCPTANEYGIEAIVQDCRPPLSCKSKYAQDGFYSSWSSWSRCSASCGFGSRTKTRKCNPPRNGGERCPGHAVETELCRVKRCGNKRSIDADFENGWGTWKNKNGNAVSWQLGRGKTSSANTGPRSDHTTGRGYYAYVSSASYRNNGRRTTLMSNLAGTKSGPKCLRFYYMMNGKNMGTLSVYLKETGTNRYLNFLAKKGHQSNKWLPAAFTIQKLNNYFNVFIEATIGFSPNSDFAIDDIFIDPGSCPLGADGCKNNNKECDYWASTGECQKNAVWMLQACCQSCRDSGCINHNKQCDFWARTGECQKNSVWMRWACCQSCAG